MLGRLRGRIIELDLEQLRLGKVGRGKKMDFRRKELCEPRTGGEKQHDIVKALIGKDVWIRELRMLVNKRWAIIRL